MKTKIIAAWDALKLYFSNNWQALDRCINALLGGSDKEYMSSRVYRYKDKIKFALLVYRFLNWIEKDHCEKAFQTCQVGADFSGADEVLK